MVEGFVRPLDQDFLDRLQAHRMADHIPSAWTPEHVAQRLVEAYRTLGIIPLATRPRQWKGYWPDYWHETNDSEVNADAYATKRADFFEGDERPTATADQVSKMDEALIWPLRYLAEPKGRWSDRGDILADALTLWAAFEASGRSPNPYLSQRLKRAAALAKSKTVTRGEGERIRRELTQERDRRIALLPRPTNTLIAKIRDKMDAEFRRRCKPRPEEVMPGVALTRSALDKWRKRASEVICAGLRKDRIVVR